MMECLQKHGIPQSYDDKVQVHENNEEFYENNEEVWSNDVELDGHVVRQVQPHMDHDHVVHTQGQQLPQRHEEVVVVDVHLHL